MPEQLTVEQAVQSLLAADKPADQPDPQNTPEEQKADPGDDTPEEPEGDEPEGADDPDDTPEEQPEPLYTVVIDGKEEQVNLEELRNGYQRGTDYQRKTSALAEQRRATDAEKAQYQERLQKASAFLAALEQAYTGREPDWAKIAKEEGNEAFLLKREQWRIHQERLAGIKAAQAQVSEEQRKEQERNLARHLAEEKDRLLAVVPEWRDPKRAQSERGEIVTYAKSLGFSDEEINGLYDHRAVNVLRKAMLFDKGKALKDKRKVESKPLTPGKVQTKAEMKGRERDRAMERLKRTGSTKDAINVLLARSK